MNSGGWCTRDVRGTYGYGMWKNIRVGAESFFRQVEYVADEGHHIRFWYNPWNVPIHLKDLYPDLFSYSVSKESWISNLVVSNLEGGNDVGDIRRLLFSIIYVCMSIIFLCFRS